MDPSDEDLRHRCYDVTGRLLTTNRWILLDHAEFTRRCSIAAKEHPAANLKYIAFGVYNQALYNACAGSEGPFRWERGYEELHEMLCKQARSRYPDIWEDAVQSALELICSNLDRCVNPQAFLEFTWGYVQNAVRSLRPHLRRKNRSPDLSIERTVGVDDVPLSDILPDPYPAIEQQILDEDRRAELRAALDEFERRRPRMRRQLLTVRMKFLDGKDDLTIGQYLGVTVKRVHELRSLCRTILREDPRLRQIFDDEDER